MTDSENKTLLEGFKYSSTLQATITNSEHLGKKARTRQSILLATALVMEQVGYNQMSVKQIIAQAEISRATFYLHFNEKSDVAAEVLRHFRQTILDERPQIVTPTDPFERIHFSNLYLINVCALNAGLLRAINELNHESKEFIVASQERSFYWVHRILRDLEHRLDLRDIHPSLLLALCNALRAMTEGLIREIYIDRDPHLQEFRNSPEFTAEILSFVWYRALYEKSPAPEKLRYAEDVIKLRMKDVLPTA